MMVPDRKEIIDKNFSGIVNQMPKQSDNFLFGGHPLLLIELSQLGISQNIHILSSDEAQVSSVVN